MFQAEKLGIHRNQMKEILEQFKNRTNPSERKEYSVYYDKESINLITEKEKLIIDKYGYQF